MMALARLVTFIFLGLSSFPKECLSTGSKMTLLDKLISDSKVLNEPPSTAGLQVDVTASLLQIKDLDEDEQVLRSSISFIMKWTDNRLAWDISSFNIPVMSLPEKRIWKPDLDIINGITGTTSAISNGVVRVNNKGLVTWYSTTHLQTSCTTNSRKFPFDRNRCQISIGSLQSDLPPLKLTSGSKNQDVDSFTENPDWILKSFMWAGHGKVKHCCPEPFSQILFTVELDRRSNIVLINIVLPSVLMVFISIIAFYLPPESGDKISLSVVMFLCMVIFQQTHLKQLSLKSNDVPLLCQYFSLCFSVLAVNIIISVIVTKVCLSANYGKRPAKWIRSLIHGCLGGLVCLPDGPTEHAHEKRPNRNAELSVIGNGQPTWSTDGHKMNTTLHRELRERFARNWYTHNLTTEPVSETNFEMKMLLTEILSCLQDIRDLDQRERQNLSFRALVRQEWKRVAMVIDRMCAYIMFFATLALCLYIFFNVYPT